MPLPSHIPFETLERDHLSRGPCSKHTCRPVCAIRLHRPSSKGQSRDSCGLQTPPERSDQCHSRPAVKTGKAPAGGICAGLNLLGDDRDPGLHRNSSDASVPPRGYLLFSPRALPSLPAPFSQKKIKPRPNSGSGGDCILNIAFDGHIPGEL